MKSQLLILIFHLLLFSSAISAQSPERVQEMEASLDTLIGVELVKMQCRLAFVYAFRDMPKAYYYGNAAIALADASDDYLAKSNAYRNMGIVYDVDAKGDSALLFFQKSLDYAKVLGSKQEISFSTNNLGMYHWNKGNLTQAIEFFIQANIIAEEINDPDGMSSAQNNICLIYNELEQPIKAIPYCERALALRRQEKDTTEILQTQNNLGIAYLELGQLATASANFQEGLSLSKYPGYEQLQDEFYTGLANVYATEGKLDLARENSLIAIGLLLKANDLYALHKQYATAAEIENKLSNYSAAIQYAQKGILITDSLGISSFNASLYKALAEGYLGIGETKKCRQALELWSAAKDSTFSKNNAEALAQKEVEYETQKKEQQILLQEAELKSKSAQNRFIIAAGLISMLLLLIGFVIWRYRQRLLRQRELQAIEIKARNDQFMAVLAAEEKERQRLARDLHDGLGQVLSTARMNVSALEDAPLPAADEVILTNSLTLIDRAVDEMRNVSHDLMPRVLVLSGLVYALEEMRDKINAGNSINLSLKNELQNWEMPKEKEIILYRVIQEILNNMLKHSGAKELALHLQEDALNYQILLSQDNGRVSEATLASEGGIGWINVKSRLEVLNASIRLADFGPRGMQFHLTVPK